jgi:HlyD family secretion protein
MYPGLHWLFLLESDPMFLIKHIQRLRWPWLFGMVVTLLALYLAVQWWRGPLIQSDVVKTTDMVQTMVASGRVQNPNRINISAQITSTVTSVQVREGQKVKQGEWLLSLDNHEAQAGLQLAMAAVAQARSRVRQLQDLSEPVAAQAQVQAESNLRTAEKNGARTEALFERGFVGQAAKDEAERQLVSVQSKGSEVANAQAALQQALAGVEAAKARMAYTRIVAPRAGTLISRNVEMGEGVQAGKVLLVLSPEGLAELVVQLDEKNMKWVRLGQSAVVSADAYPDQLFKAEVVFINPSVDPLRGSVEVKLKVLEVPAFLTQDMTVSVDIEIDKRTAVLQLPLSAVHSIELAPWVLLVRDGHAVKTPVTLGLRGLGVVQVLTGLTSGDHLVPGAASTVQDGDRLRTNSP